MDTQPQKRQEKAGRRRHTRVRPFLAGEMRGMMYILDADHNPVPCDGDLDLWIDWMDSYLRRIVGRTVVVNDRDGKRIEVLVSTVFLGHYGMFEMMAFSDDAPELDGWSIKVETWRDAEKVHAACVTTIEGYLKVRDDVLKEREGGDAAASGVASCG